MEKAERISDILSREWNMFQKVQNTGILRDARRPVCGVGRRYAGLLSE